MKFIDYYALLGVPRTASQEEVQRSYRKLARKYHPDVNKDTEALQKFKEINEAYEVLKDPEKRGKYDKYGEYWKQAERGGGVPPGGMPPGWEGVTFDMGDGTQGFSFGGGEGFSSFFEMLFGMPRRGGAPGGGPRGTRVARGHDAEGVLTLTLEEAAHGGQRALTLIDPATGQPRSTEVKVPAGVTTGGRIRLPGQGSGGMGGGPAGDLYLRVEILPHPRFRLDGRDLQVTLDVTPWDAALGGEARLPTLDGDVNVKVPRGSSSGRRIRLRGKGFPNPKGEPGDLYAEIRIVVPEDLTPEEEELFRKLSETSDFSPAGRRDGKPA
jgi:curved DNA-binding protein